MQRRLVGFPLTVIAILMVLPSIVLGPVLPVMAAQGFAATQFRELWTRADQPVEDLSAKRSWLWGPQPLDAPQESYTDAPGGRRLVQYFDKSRMELTNPATGTVTNGLLATELISGRMQTGDAVFEDRGPAEVNVAGDDDDTGGPLYASLKGVLNQPALPVGTTVTETLGRDGTVVTDETKATHKVTATNFIPETGHTVASVFWNYLQTSGPVVVNKTRRVERLFEPWYAAVGLPKSRPYWAKVKVAGKVQDVLVQAFERRVLTYTPANPDGFKVEMGNIGRHYFKWRYGKDPTPSTVDAAPQPVPSQPADNWRPLVIPHIGYGFNGFYTFTPAEAPSSVANVRRSMDLVAGANFTWVRQQVVWATLEPAPGQYDTAQLAALDATVREARQRGIQLMFSIAKSPRWAVANDAGCHDGGGVKLCGLPTDPTRLASVLSFLTDRYKRDSEYGRVRAWEIWNEQNTGGETGGNVNAGAYVEQLKLAYLAVKAADNSAIVVFGGLTPTGVMDKTIAIDDVVYLEQVYQYQNGVVRRYFDVLGAHPGSNNNAPDAYWPSNDPAKAKTICAQQGRQWCDHPSFYFRRIEQLRGVMEKYGDANYNGRLKQIWLTEFGWTTANSAPGYEYGAQISEETQAKYLVRAFEMGRNDYPWMGVMFVWTLNHSVVVPSTDEKYPWSVLRGDWSPRPSYIALRDMPR